MNNCDNADNATLRTMKFHINIIILYIIQQCFHTVVLPCDCIVLPSENVLAIYMQMLDRATRRQKRNYIDSSNTYTCTSIKRYAIYAW